MGREVFFYEAFPGVWTPEVLGFFMEKLIQVLISFSQIQVVPINSPLWSYTDGFRLADPQLSSIMEAPSS